jgi:DNA replication and repair protein RecF
LFLKNIHITNFSNLSEESFEFHPELNVVVGHNGMGKTNVLDSIHYLCLTRSNFSRLDRYNIQHDKDFARLAGTFMVKEKSFQINIKMEAGARKVVEKNGKAYDKLSDHIGLFPLVMIAPKDNVLILDSSAERRKLLDRIIAQTHKDFLVDLVAYNKLLDQRNALLKSGTDRRAITQLLPTYDERMAPLAANIFRLRNQFVNDLRPVFRELYTRIADENESASISYSSKMADQDFRELMQSAVEKDLVLKRTTAGVHKDDILFRINDSSVKNYASQGQLKSLVLAFKLAQFAYLKDRTVTTPIILLDDVFDKLDRKRVKHLVKLLFDEKLGQVFISDTDGDRIVEIFDQTELDFKIFTIQNGTCVSEKTFNKREGLNEKA